MYAIRSYYADLLSQAEHDEMATTVLATTSMEFAGACAAAVEEQLEALSRTGTARASWEERGAIFVVETLEQVCALSNRRITSYNVCYTKLLRGAYSVIP